MPAALAPTKPGDHFRAEFHPADDALVFHRIALEEKEFLNGTYSTDFIEKHDIVKQARHLAKKEKEKQEK